MNKKYIKYLAILGAALVLTLMIFPHLLPFDLNGESKKEKQQTKTSDQKKGVVIDAIVVEETSFNNDIVLAGSLLADESVQLSSEVSGKIDRIYFSEGDYVKKGQMLVSTNTRDLQANLKRLNYTQKLYKQTEERQKQLLESEAISKEDYDMAFTNLKTVEAEIEALRAQIAKSQIKAPFSGYIGLRYVSEGSYITTNTQIASLYAVDPIKIEFSVPSRYSQFIKKNDQINFTTEGSSENLSAKIYALEPKIDPVTRTLKVRAIRKNPNNDLIPGQFVRVNLNLESDPDAILIPTTAIMPKADGHLVYVIKNGVALEKEVQLGIRTARKVEIVKGLASGDTIAIAGVPQLKNNASVSIKNLESKQ